jgi:hypothetical protein
MDDQQRLEEILSRHRHSAEDLYWVGIHGFGPTPESVDRALSHISERSADLPADRACWLIKREHLDYTNRAGVQDAGPRRVHRVRAFIIGVQAGERGYPHAEIEFTAPGGQLGSLCAQINLWARYSASDFESLREVGADRTRTLEVEHRCDYRQAFGNANR